MNKDAYYFSHDSNSRNDLKIKSLIRNSGFEGYGRFWVIIEILREQTEYKLSHDTETYETLAEELRITHDEAKAFVELCIKRYKLLTSDGECFYSESLIRRMEKMNNIRERRKEAGKRSAEARLKKKE
jgi:hypothetical protein